MKKTRNKRSGKQYFTKEHEQAILDYVALEDQEEREKLYRTVISPVLNELIRNVVFTYKFNTIPNFEALCSECAAHLSVVLNKFDSTKGTKAFSYFTVAIKNWFFAEKKKIQRQLIIESNFEDLSKVDLEGLTEDHQYDPVREKHEFWNSLIDELNYWESDMDGTSEDLLVYRAFKILIDHVDELEVLNRRAVFQYLRKLTGLTTSNISGAVNKLTENYKEFKNAWDQGEI